MTELAAKGAIPKKQDGIIIGRSSGKREMAAAGAVLYMLVALLCASLVDGATDPNDVSTLNFMFTDMNNNPRLTNWVQSAGDPCGNNWLGITCDGGFVSSIKLSNLGLNGKVEGWVIQKFSRLTTLDLSGNNFDSSVPALFPSKLTDINLSNNQFKDSFPYGLYDCPGLKSIKFNNNKLDGTLNGQIFTKLVNVVTFDISSNEISGSIPGQIGDNMASLQFLYLQNNKLTGQLPTSLANLMPLLDTFDVSNNQITGYLPPNFKPRNLRTDGTAISKNAPPPPPYTAPPPPRRRANPPSAPSGSSSFLTGPRIAGIVVVIVLVLAAIIIAVWFLAIRKRSKRTKKPDVEASNHSNRRSFRFPPLFPTKTEKTSFGADKPRKVGKEKTSKAKIFEPETLVTKTEEPKKILKATPPVKALKVPPAFKGEDPVAKSKATGGGSKVTKPRNIAATAFSVADLQAATDSFSPNNLLGEGRMGCVYRADMPDGQILAVKKLDPKAGSMIQNEDDFLSVVEGLAHLQHAHAAELVGYCAEHDQRLLVYKYISRGTLYDLLHGTEENTKGLSWNMRVKIALGAARALEYLHEVCSPPVVHRNFKAANILLDDELNPHVSDCGLAAFAPSGVERQASAQLLGSVGYSAPEYSMSGTYTVKSDVYSFGVVMLELLTGRQPLDSSRPRSEQSLVRWATPQLHDIDALARMVDPALEGVYPAKSLSRLADIVALCVQPEPEFRPPMSEVVQSLVRLMQRATLSIKRRSSGAASDMGPSSPSDIQEYD